MGACRDGQSRSIALSVMAGAVAVGLAAATSSRRRGATPRAPRYTADGKLEFPKDYRTWVYLSTGHGHVLCRGPPAGRTATPSTMSSSIREAYAAFQKTGTWPDKTVLRAGGPQGRRARGSINKSGPVPDRPLGAEVAREGRRRASRAAGPSSGFNGEGPAPTALPQTAAATPATSSTGRWTPPSCSSTRRCCRSRRPRRRFSAAYLAEEAQGEVGSAVI